MATKQDLNDWGKAIEKTGLAAGYRTGEIQEKLPNLLEFFQIHPKNLDRIQQISLRDLICYWQNGDDLEQWLDSYLNLDCSLHALRKVHREKILPPAGLLERACLNHRCNRLARLYEDACFRHTRHRFQLTSQYQRLQQHRCWNSLVRLNRVLRALKVSRKNERMYLNAAYYCRPRQHVNIPLQILASPLCALDYVYYLCRVWKERYRYDRHEPRMHHLQHGMDAYQEDVSIAFGQLEWMGKLARRYGSRLAAEIPEALQSDPPFLLIAYSSPLIYNLWRRRLLADAYPELHRSLCEFSQSLRKDSELKESLQQVRKQAQRQFAGVPLTSREADRHSLRLLSELSPEQTRLQNWYKWAEQRGTGHAAGRE